MGRFIKIELTDDQRKELENGYRNGKSHAFRTRCQMVLLKSEGRKSQDIADFLGFCQQAVNNWLNRYKQAGVDGLKVKEGRGRPSILSPSRTPQPHASMFQRCDQRLRTSRETHKRKA